MSDFVAAVLALHAVYVLAWAGLVLVAVGHNPAFLLGLFCWLLALSITVSIATTTLAVALLRVREALR